MRELPVKTSLKEQMVDITGLVQEAVSASGVAEGICFIFCPHSTCGLTINESAPDIVSDTFTILNKIAPPSTSYEHADGNSPAHVKASIMGSSVTVIVSGGRAQLGGWQSIILCEFDGPRQRKVWFRITP